MGSPISGLIAEILLQSLEHTHIKPLLETKRIILYTRYVHRRHPHNLRRSADQPRHHHALRQLHQQQP